MGEIVVEHQKAGMNSDATLGVRVRLKDALTVTPPKQKPHGQVGQNLRYLRTYCSRFERLILGVQSGHRGFDPQPYGRKCRARTDEREILYCYSDLR